MAYHLKLGESIPEGIRRVVHEEMESAAGQLSGKGSADRDKAIHEARKSVKKIRGALRLLRPELGDNFRAENTRMRDVGRRLSEFRDAGAMLETFDALLEKCSGELAKHTLASIRTGLAARKEQVEKQAKIERALSSMAGALGRAGKRVKTWPLAADGFAAIAPGLEETFREGRKALARVRKHPRPENYHEWRKRVKDHWYHVRLLENLWNDAMQAYEKSVKELEAWLGEDHNLVVLGEKVLAEPAFYGNTEQIHFFGRVIDKYHKELRGSALAAGASIYEEKPRQFTARMQHLWDAWQAQPARHAVAPR
jgi:CHAD domain-containing protein